jgi:hypothetical protein
VRITDVPRIIMAVRCSLRSGTGHYVLCYLAPHGVARVTAVDPTTLVQVCDMIMLSVLPGLSELGCIHDSGGYVCTFPS